MPKPQEIAELPEGQDTFDRAYVEKLRAEAAKWRTSLRPFEDAFGDFSEDEKAFLFDIISTLNADPKEGARKMRETSLNILADEFYEGLDLPKAEPEAEEEEPPTEEPNEQEEEDQVSLTKEEMQAMLDERDAKTKAERDAAEQERIIEEVYAEIEAVGFERGTEGFLTILSLANAQVQAGKDVDFKALAPTVHSIVGTEAPVEDAETETDDEPEGEGEPRHPVTAGAGGSGAATENPKDWIEAARAEGKTPMEAARERMEARLGES